MNRFLLISAMFACVLTVTVFATSSAQAGEVRRPAHAGEILHFAEMPRERYFFGSVKIRSEPSIFATQISHVYRLCWRPFEEKYVGDVVEYLGETRNGWIKIQYPATGKHACWHHNTIIGWVYGEFFGVTQDDSYEAFTAPVEYKVVADEAVARDGPSMRRNPHLLLPQEWPRYTYKKNTRLLIRGKRGNWYQTIGGYWIYHELIELSS